MRTRTLRRTKRTCEPPRWLWNGYLQSGRITLLTGPWKTGKTTLLAGLLRQLGRGGMFLGQTVRPGKAWIVSEEPVAHWGRRLARIPIGEHVELFARPFHGRPTLDDWQAIIDEALDARSKGDLDLLVIDTLTVFLPSLSERDPAAVKALLHMLTPLLDKGVAVLIVQHLHREPSALLGKVDIVLELRRHGWQKLDSRQRTILSQSRREETPSRLSYEWTSAGDFQIAIDALTQQFEAHWQQIRKILKRRGTATQLELQTNWPADQPKPCTSSLYEWLNRAIAEKKLRREGNGTRYDPWRYRLPTPQDEYYDRGELPPTVDLS